MSYFLAGRFRFTCSLSSEEQVKLAFELTERALANHVALQIGYNIVQPIAFEILGKELDLSKSFPFLLTDSPISDTADDLLIYWSESRDEMRAKVTFAGERLRDVLASIKLIEYIADAILFISEGYDTSYRREEVSLESLPRRLVELAEEYDWLGLPSVELHFQFRDVCG